MVSLFRIRFFATLLGLGTGLLAQAQQVMPALVRQIPVPSTINFNTIDATQDARGNLWLATQEGIVRFDGRQFRTYHDPVLREGDDYFHVVPSPDGRIWCKQGRGSVLSYIDPKLDKIVRVPDTSRLVRDYLVPWRSNYLFADADANLWIGLRRHGLIRFNPRTYAIDPIFDREGEAVRRLTQDQRGLIWFTTNQAVYAYNPVSHALKRYREEFDRRPANGKFAIGIHARRDGTILVGLDKAVAVIQPTTGRVTRLEFFSNDANPDQVVYDFYDDPQGNTYFSTFKAYYRYTNRGDLQQLEFSGIRYPLRFLYPDRNNRLWVTAGQSLVEYDLTRLRPVPAFSLLDVLINGTRLTAASARQQLVRDSLGHPTLTVQAGDLIGLTVSPYVVDTGGTGPFRLRLQGYDQWTVTEDPTYPVSYELPTGTYTLLLNRFVAQSGWEKTVSTLTIIVQPPFWKTGWFWSVVLVVVGAVGAGFLQNWTRRRRLRQELARREFEAATLREVDELKSRFFTNITHELRTPLTIILNATEQLAHAPLGEADQQRLLAVQRNARQLNRLIDETLDMAKLDAGKLDRRERTGDPVAFVGQVVEQFQGLAQQRQLRLDWLGQPTSEQHYGFDDDKLEKITYNLLSNALKFTPAPGSVRVECRVTDSHTLLLRVADTGIGIAADQQSRIFERFHQVDSSPTRAYSGTGIGLALVKELADWLGGSVAVESTVGQGSVFTLTLPLTPNGVAHAPGVAESSVPDQRVSAVGRRPVGTTETVTDHDETNWPLLLVVEDNEELRSFIGESLSAQYRIHTAENGRRGLELALAEVPDLIVSDVMMPEMDGYALVERLKADDRTSHIPVVLLTAKSSYDSRMIGLGIGADDYLGKPFSLAELALRIGNCLRTRQNWQRWLMQHRPADGATSTDPQLAREDQFLARLRQLILDHLTDEAVDVDWLTKQAGMSRTQLHRKLTALTNMSTTRFIHSVRIGQAVALLQRSELNVAQVAQAVGYGSQSYFTKIFQEQVGYLPTALKI